MAARWSASLAVLALIVCGCEQESPSDGSGTTGGTTSSAPGPSASTGGAGGEGSGGAANVSTFTLRPKSLVGKIDMSGIADAVKNFEINMGRYPTSAEGLKVLVSGDGLEKDSDKWQGPYVQSMDVLVDTYGNPLEYETTGSGFVLRSLGADGARGGSGSSADIELRN